MQKKVRAIEGPVGFNYKDQRVGHTVIDRLATCYVPATPLFWSTLTTTRRFFCLPLSRLVTAYLPAFAHGPGRKHICERDVALLLQELSDTISPILA